MKEKMRKFLKVLSVELEDLKEDLKYLQEQYGQRKDTGEITDYVFLENVSMIEREHAGISAAEGILSALSIEQFSDVDALANGLMNTLDEKLTAQDTPPAVLDFLKRKIIKVKRFVID